MMVGQGGAEPDADQGTAKCAYEDERPYYDGSHDMSSLFSSDCPTPSLRRSHRYARVQQPGL